MRLKCCPSRRRIGKRRGPAYCIGLISNCARWGISGNAQGAAFAIVVLFRWPPRLHAAWLALELMHRQGWNRDEHLIHLPNQRVRSAGDQARRPQSTAPKRLAGTMPRENVSGKREEKVVRNMSICRSSPSAFLTLSSSLVTSRRP